MKQHGTASPTEGQGRATNERTCGWQSQQQEKETKKNEKCFIGGMWACQKIRKLKKQEHKQYQGNSKKVLVFAAFRDKGKRRSKKEGPNGVQRERSPNVVRQGKNKKALTKAEDAGAQPRRWQEGLQMVRSMKKERNHGQAAKK